MARFNAAALNIFSLAAIQGANALLPLVVYPLVLLRLGPDPYGMIVQAEALSLFLLALVLYSFEVTGVAAAVGVEAPNELEKLSNLVSSVLTVRLGLFLIGAPTLVTIAYVINDDLVWPTLAWCLVPLSFALSPNFLMQALRDNLVLATVNIVTRAAAVTLVAILVHRPDDFMLVPVIIGTCYVAGAVASLALSMRKHSLSLGWVGWSHLRQIMHSGREVFFGNLSTILYRDSYIIILGIVGAPSVAIATFSIAEKLTKAFQAVIRPLNQHFFPQAIALARQDAPRRRILSAMLQLSALQQAALLALSGAIGLGYWLFGSTVEAMSGVLELHAGVVLFFPMAIATLFGVANFMLGTAGLNAMGETRFVLRCLLGTGIISLLLGFVLISQWQASGAAASFIFGEILLFSLFVMGYMRPADKAVVPRLSERT